MSKPLPKGYPGEASRHNILKTLHEIYERAVEQISADPEYPDTPPKHWQAALQVIDDLLTQTARPGISTRFVEEISAVDPDTGAEVALEIHKDPQSGALFAVEASFAEQIDEAVKEPYNGTRVRLGAPKGPTL